MAKRTDRQRVKWQGEAMLKAMDNAIEHGAKLDMMADKQSDYINKKLPIVITGIQLARDLAKHFIDGL